MKIKTLIENKVVHTIRADVSVKELVEKLTQYRIGAFVVSPDGKKIDGIVSERDVVRALANNFELSAKLQVRDLMSTDVFTCTSESLISDIMRIMTRERVRHIPVLDEAGNLLSIISIGDVVSNHVNELATENQALRDYLATAN